VRVAGLTNPIFESLLGFTVGVKKQQIEVRVGKQPLPPESPQGDQCEIPGASFLWIDHFRPETESNLFHQRSPLGDGCAAISGGRKLLPNSRRFLGVKIA
jgi:hypothetical protein